MIKNLTGGSIIQYGSTFPASAESYDGALFFKTAGSDSGLYIFSFSQDSNPAAVGDQVGQGWTTVVNAASFVSKTGDKMSGPLEIAGLGARSQPFGMLSITMPADGNNYAHIALSRADRTGWSIGVDKAQRFFVGLAPASATSAVTESLMTLTYGGLMQLAGNKVWHAGNDGSGSGLDADLLDGHDSQYFLDAIGAGGPQFTPVEQGGGTDQGTNKVYIGWAASGVLNLQVDATNFASTWPISISGSAVSANTANSANTAANATNATSAQYLRARGASNGSNMTFFPDAPGGSPNYVWGTNDGINAFIYNPTNVTVGNATNAQFANTAASATTVDWAGITNRPNFGNYIDRSVDTWKTSVDGTNRFYFGSGGRTIYSGSDHEFRNTAGSSLVTISNGGNLIAAGDVTGFSDARLKTDVKRIENALDRVDSLVGVTFTRKANGTRGTGLIAQNVKEVLPEAVQESADGMLSVAYGNIVGLLIEAIKELREEVKELKAKV